MKTEKMMDMSMVIINMCPRCGSKNVKIKTASKQANSIKIGKCEDCELAIEAMDANFIAWLFNRSKEETVAHILRDLNMPPYTAYVHPAEIDIWDGEMPLKHYISREKGWKTTMRSAVTVGKGYVIERIT